VGGYPLVTDDGCLRWPTYTSHHLIAPNHICHYARLSQPFTAELLLRVTRHGVRKLSIPISGSAACAFTPSSHAADHGVTFILKAGKKS
jgi:hypothetical protein